jgi:hypothetical protein
MILHLFSAILLQISLGKLLSKDIFRNELNERVMRWQSPLGEIFLLKENHNKIFKLFEETFKPIKIIEMVENVSHPVEIDYPSDIDGDSSGNISFQDCAGHVNKLSAIHPEQYVQERADSQNTFLFQSEYSRFTLCSKSLRNSAHLSKNRVSVATITTSQGIKITGETNTYTGRSVSIGGDLNGDGKADMLIGASGYSSFTGRVYVIYGGSSLTDVASGSLTLSQGIKITGETGSQAGSSVSIGGDVNGDGKADMLIGASGYSSFTGRVYVIYGGSSLTDIALESLTSSQGIKITGEGYSSAGVSVSIGGDVNGDGKADMLIGASEYSDSSLTGRVYVIYGSSNLTDIELGSLTSSQGIKITGESANSNTGSSVSIGGDVNGDGKADMLIGAYGRGRVYIIYGSASLTDIALGSLTSSQGIKITGESANSYTGCSVCIGGDLNGDGKADLLIGATGYSSNTGRVYVIYGSSSLTDIALGSLISSLGIKITGESANSYTGGRVSIGGDVNGDGKADMLIGATGYSSNTGRVYVIYGSASLTDIALGSLISSQGIKITGELPNSDTGFSVSIGGDVNGDGKADILIGATGSSTGRVYLIYGTASTAENVLLGSEYPTSRPSGLPSSQPSMLPSGQPTSVPTGQPSSSPSVPTGQPTSVPTCPSGQPTNFPTSQPLQQPTSQPTKQPVSMPTSQPSRQPTSQPTKQPVSKPTSQPSRQPTSQPSRQPTSQPSRKPTSQPSAMPTNPLFQTYNFLYTGSVQTLSVPSDVNSMYVDITGSAGGVGVSYGAPGKGARIQSILQVSAGSALNIYVGGSNGKNAGWNGGGTGGNLGPSSGGGGASDIRVGGTALINRIIVAGGGGGYYGNCAYFGGLPTLGGHGGLVGMDGSSCCGDILVGGSGGTQSLGGYSAGAVCGNQPGTAGTLGVGGNGGAGNGYGGGGGGGYYGGGGGSNQGSGGGGSSYSEDPSAVFTTGYQASSGTVSITFYKMPTSQPSVLPSSQPSSQPSIPTGQPSSLPTIPSSQPSSYPTCPSGQPTNVPTSQPSHKPTEIPTSQPSRQPTSQPSRQPAAHPTSQPTKQPIGKPTSQPSRKPTSQPSRQPSSHRLHSQRQILRYNLPATLPHNHLLLRQYSQLYNRHRNLPPSQFCLQLFNPPVQPISLLAYLHLNRRQFRQVSLPPNQVLLHPPSLFPSLPHILLHNRLDFLRHNHPICHLVCQLHFLLLDRLRCR